MHCLNEYYKSHIHESVTLKEKRLIFFEHSLCAPQLCAEFLERIVRTIRGFTVLQQHVSIATQISYGNKYDLLQQHVSATKSIYWSKMYTVQQQKNTALTMIYCNNKDLQHQSHHR